MHYLSNFLFFGIPLLYYCINLNSLIVCCLSRGDIYLSFGISLLASFDDNSLEWNSFGDFFENQELYCHLNLQLLLLFF